MTRFDGYIYSRIIGSLAIRLFCLLLAPAMCIFYQYESCNYFKRQTYNKKKKKKKKLAVTVVTNSKWRKSKTLHIWKVNFIGLVKYFSMKISGVIQ